MAKRQSIRFFPDPGAYAQIDVTGECDPSAFHPTIVALITDEAFKGCGLVALKVDDLQKDAICSIRVGRIGPISAKIMWRKEIDPNVIKIGIEFDE